MRLGIDFDNTLVQYHHVFHRAAIEKKLIPESLPANKTRIRDFIRDQQGAEAWTKLQGYVYGKLIGEAQAFNGALEGLQRCQQESVSLVLISHKTEWPVLGPKWNLHEAARGWLRLNRLYDADASQNLLDGVWFEETREGKLNRVAQQECDAFIDDLPDILMDASFPPSAVPILFDPDNNHRSQSLSQLGSWNELPSLLKKMELI